MFPMRPFINSKYCVQDFVLGIGSPILFQRNLANLHSGTPIFIIKIDLGRPIYKILVRALQYTSSSGEFIYV